MARNDISHPARARRPMSVEGLEARSLLSATASIVGYLPDYEINGLLTTALKNSAFSGLTQINYFSVLPNASGLLPGTTVGGSTNTGTKTSGGVDLPPASSQLRTLITDAHAAGVKVSIVVGGGGSYSTTLNPTVRGGLAKWQTFASSVTQFISTYGLDGIDIDWEPQSLLSTDVVDYGNFLATVRSSNPNISITTAVDSGKLSIEGTTAYSYILNAVALVSLTQVNVMAYDLDLSHGDGSPIALAKTKLTGWGNYATSLGVSKSKLVFGMPFYGTSLDGAGISITKKYRDLIASSGATLDPSADSVTIAGKLWRYNGPTTIGAKTAFALDGGYGGVTTWEVGQDYLKDGAFDPTNSLLPQFALTTSMHTGTVNGSVRNASDTPIAGAKVFLDLNNNSQFDPSDLSVVTDLAGNFVFSGLLIGSYNLRQIVPDGYTQISPATGLARSINVTAGSSAVANFAIAPPALPGDANADGIVNFDDLVIVSQNYGSIGKSYSQGNFDFSAGGEVNFDDLVILAQNYNRSVIPQAVLSSAVSVTRAKSRAAPQRPALQVIG